MHLHLHPSSPHLHRHPLAEIDVERLAGRTGATLLAAYGIAAIFWGFNDADAPDLMVSLGLYALGGSLGALLAPRTTGIVLVLSSLVGPVIALSARWLGQTYATQLSDGQLVALFAVPFCVGMLLCSVALRRLRPRS